MSDEKRPYRMRRRAELEEETRRRITESAVALHEKVGPAQTSITAIADLAGVRRSTVYRHFPDEDALFAACSSHWRLLNPPPDLESWAAIEDPGARVEAALGELYAFYGRTHRMYESLFRDESLVPAVRRRLRDFHGYLAAARDALLAGRPRPGRRTRASIGHALAFGTWRSLTQEQQLSEDDAVALMCRLVESSTRR
jgi:AcrR family transcriptional regulator